MNKHTTVSRAAGLLGIAVLGALLFLSLRFWMERMFITDMAFHTFVIAESGGLAIQNHRFGAAITQLFPLTAFYLHLPLKTVLQLYSASFYIWYLIVFAVIVFFFNNWKMGIVLLCYLTLLVSYSFFWAQSEYPQGMVFLLFFLTVLLHPFTHHTVHYLLLLVLLVVTVFFHPLIILSLCFAVGYFYLNQQVSFKKALLVLAVAVLILVCKTYFLKTASYESSKMGGAANILHLFPHYFTPSSSFFVRQLPGDYAGYLLLLLLVAGYYVKNGLYVKMGWVAAATAGYLLLVNISFPWLEKSTYLQNLHSALAIFVALPLAFEIIPKIKPGVWVSMLSLLFVFRLAMIYHSHSFYTQRIVSIQSLLDKSKAQATNRFWIADDALPADIYEDEWALAYETLLLSSVPSPDSARTIEMQSVVMQHSFLLDSTNVFINRLWGWDTKNLPKEYFRLKPNPYRELCP